MTLATIKDATECDKLYDRQTFVINRFPNESAGSRLQLVPFGGLQYSFPFKGIGYELPDDVNSFISIQNCWKQRLNLF